MRRGQLLGHIIIFVLGLIVIGGVLLFGFQVLKGIDEDRCDVARVQFATSLSTFFDRNRGWGTVKPVTLDAPCETTHVCFVDRKLIDDRQAGNEQVTVEGAPAANVETIIKTSVNAQDPTNVFTVQTGGIVLPVERFSSVSAPISVTENDAHLARCIAVSGGQISFIMEGTGNLVEIKNAR